MRLGDWRRAPAQVRLDDKDRTAPAVAAARARAGALVIHTPARLHRAAIEIHAVGAPWAGTHTAVEERRVGEQVRYEGVFDDLDAGSYELRVLGAFAGVVVPIVIQPGAVAETWLDAPVD